jgi:hypothetical protein
MEKVRVDASEGGAVIICPACGNRDRLEVIVGKIDRRGLLARLGEGEPREMLLAIHAAIWPDMDDPDREISGADVVDRVSGVFADAGCGPSRFAETEGLTPMGNEDPLHDLWERARLHGLASEPEHEVGDLQDLSRLCWDLLTPEQRDRVASEFSAQMDDADGGVSAWRRNNPETSARVHRMTRQEIVDVLDAAGIQCYVHESVNAIREVLFVNLADGTIDASHLPEEG